MIVPDPCPRERIITAAGIFRRPLGARDLSREFLDGGIALFFAGPARDRVLVQMILDAVTPEAASALLQWYDVNADLDLWVARFNDPYDFKDNGGGNLFETAERVCAHRDLHDLLRGKLIYGLA